jgi:hypothetical protein
MVAPAAGLFARYIHERAHSAEGAQSNVQCTEAPSGIDSTALQPHGGYCVPSGHLEPVGTLEPVRPQSKNEERSRARDADERRELRRENTAAA